MKKINLIILLLCIKTFSFAQRNISPNSDTEFCPLQNITFTVTLPTGATGASITGTGGASVITNPNNNTANFTFTGRFSDFNQPQTFTVSYSGGNIPSPYIVTFKKVKSLNSGACDNIFAPAINAPICQISTIPFTFTPLKWKTDFTNPLECFGSIGTYEYLIPIGWQLNGTPSTGNWIAGTNSVTFTSNATSGGVLQIRPINSGCGANLNKGAISVVNINRQAPTFSISPSNVSIVCNVPKTQTFTINQAGTSACTYTYTWELGANNGWVYNGAAAPATINTATNTITLTSCGLFQKNIAAKVSTGSSTYNTNAAVINSNCNFAIAGSANFCKTSTFAINNLASLPSNAIINWSLSNGTTATLSNLTGSTTTVTKAGFPANVNLIASITVPSCNSVFQITRALVVGSTEAPVNLQPIYGLDCNSTSFIVNQSVNGSITYTTTNGLLINGGASPQTVYGNTVVISPPAPGISGVVSAVSTSDCARLINDYFYNIGCTSWLGNYSLITTYGSPQRGEPLQAQIDPMPEWPSGATYYWYLNNNYFTTTYAPNLNTYDWPCNNGNETNIAVVAVVPEANGYNSTPPLSTVYFPLCTGARLSNTTVNLLIYPNPATGMVTIKLEEILSGGLKTNNQQPKKINNTILVRVLDKLGNVRKTFTYRNNEKIVNINIAELQADLYYIEVINGMVFKKIPLNVIK